jgi:hypothetical protein
MPPIDFAVSDKVMMATIEKLNSLIPLVNWRSERTNWRSQGSMSMSEFQDNNVCNINLNPEVKQEDISSANDALISSQNIAINDHKSENEMHHYHSQVEPSSSRTLIFDTKDWYYVCSICTESKDNIIKYSFITKIV